MSCEGIPSEGRQQKSRLYLLQNNDFRPTQKVSFQPSLAQQISSWNVSGFSGKFWGDGLLKLPFPHFSGFSKQQKQNLEISAGVPHGCCKPMAPWTTVEDHGGGRARWISRWVSWKATRGSLARARPNHGLPQVQYNSISGVFFQLIRYFDINGNCKIISK